MSAGKTSENQAFDRSALRRELIQRRQLLSAATCRDYSQRICAHLRANFPELANQRVGFCWPVNNEPDLRPLLLSWLADSRGCSALLPVVVDSNAPLAFRAWNPETPMHEDRYGIPTPSTGEFLRPEALLIPVNAVDAAGYRLGYGGGFFDRTLAALDPRPLCIGVGFELCRVDSIRPQPHDMRLNAMVTEAGVSRYD